MMNEKRTNLNYSKIEDHKRDKKRLLPPFSQIQNASNSSWVMDRMPEMIWVGLIHLKMGRDMVLEILRNIAARNVLDRNGIKSFSGGLTSLTEQSPEFHEYFFETLGSYPEIRTILRPLNLLENLPGKELWDKFITETAPSEDWNFLAEAIAPIMPHQSPEATDLRWFRLLCFAYGGGINLPDENMANQIAHYPHFGEQSFVRPSIRACEMAIEFDEEKEWSKIFWQDAFTNTLCLPYEPTKGSSDIFHKEMQSKGMDVIIKLKSHYLANLVNSNVDAKMDAVFGIPIYACTILLESLRTLYCNSCSARIILRTIFECYATLRYMIEQSDQSIFQVYRTHGTGQAKLGFLKFAEKIDPPSSLDFKELEYLINEDYWHEMVEVNLGHWIGGNLRKICEEIGIIEEYDKYYSWTSGFVHGQWSAVRTSVFTICVNPLHKYHRVPKRIAYDQPSILPDACILVNKMLNLVNQEYSGFEIRLPE